MSSVSRAFTNAVLAAVFYQMRNYKHKAINEGSDWDDDIIGISEKDDTQLVRTEYYYHSDDGCYWAKNIEGQVYYSDDDVFSTEKEDATHIVVFLK